MNARHIRSHLCFRFLVLLGVSTALNYAEPAFSADVSSGSGQVEVLHQFTGGADGFILQGGGVMIASNGTIFGATNAGGTGYCFVPGLGCGTIYRFSQDGTYTTLYSFNGSDGAGPNLPVEGSQGDLFGTTFGGGDYDAGVIYRISQNGSFEKILSFTGGPDGGNSRAPLILGEDGNLYGSNTSGGAYGCGTVFRMTTAGSLTTLASIPCGYADGPSGALTEGHDGSLYGMLGFGGYGSCASGCGGVFRVTPDGVLSMLVTFDDKTNGANASDMSLIKNGQYYYGMTTGDGTGADAGTAFRMTPDGTLTTLVNFTNMPYGDPGSSFIPAPNSAFYGSLNSGGDNFFGALFKMTKTGHITLLVSYTYATGSPTGSMVMGKDGKIYFSSSYNGGVFARISLP